MQKRMVQVFPTQARATWDDVGLLLLKESWYVKLLFTSVARAPVCWCCWIVLCLLLSWTSGGSVLNASGEEELCVVVVAVVGASFMCVACAFAIGSVVVVVTVGSWVLLAV